MAPVGVFPLVVLDGGGGADLQRSCGTEVPWWLCSVGASMSTRCKTAPWWSRLCCSGWVLRACSDHLGLGRSIDPWLRWRVSMVLPTTPFVGHHGSQSGSGRAGSNHPVLYETSNKVTVLGSLSCQDKDLLDACHI
jgi:hypothetical protein